MTFSAIMNDKKVTIWQFCDLFSNYERQKGHNSAIMNDIVNDKKGHNFMNDIKRISRFNFLLVYRELLLWFGRNIGKIVAPFAIFPKQEVLPFWIFIWKVKSEEVGCILLELLSFTIMNDIRSRSNYDLLWTTQDLDLIVTFLWTILNLDLIGTFLWMTPSRSNCDLFMNDTI